MATLHTLGEFEDALDAADYHDQRARLHADAGEHHLAKPYHEHALTLRRLAATEWDRAVLELELPQ